MEPKFKLGDKVKVEMEVIGVTQTKDGFEYTVTDHTSVWHEIRFKESILDSYSENFHNGEK